MTPPNESGPTDADSPPNAREERAVYDLTQPVASGMPVYPGDPAVAIESHARMADDGYRTSAVSLGSHAGTHVDAPAHTEPDGRTLDEFNVQTFRFDAAVIDCTDVGARSAITRKDLETGDHPADVDAVLLHTGWDEHWGTERYRDHPFLAPAAAEWLAEQDYHVGFDTFGPDPTPPVQGEPGDDGRSDAEPAGVPAHHALLGAERLVIENLRGLDRLPGQVTVHAYPMAIENADGSPVRAVAVVR